MIEHRGVSWNSWQGDSFNQLQKVKEKKIAQFDKGSNKGFIDKQMKFSSILVCVTSMNNSALICTYDLRGRKVKQMYKNKIFIRHQIDFRYLIFKTVD